MQNSKGKVLNLRDIIFHNRKNIKTSKNRTLNYFYQETLFDKPKEKPKSSKKNLVISLLNISKNIVKDTEIYNSYVATKKKIGHIYPFTPYKTNNNFFKYRLHTQNGENDFYLEKNSTLTTPRAIRNSSRRESISDKINKKEVILLGNFKQNSIRKALIEKKHPTPNINEKMDSNSFIRFIDKFNSMANVIHKYNDYKEKYFVDKNKDGNKEILLELLNKYTFNKEEEKLFNERHTRKKNDFKIKNFKVSIKMSSLTLKFFEINKTDKILNSEIKFPFQFLPFFYGINYIDFNKFLVTIIEYDYINNKFKINYNNFMKRYREFKSKKKVFYNENSFFNIYNNENSKLFFQSIWEVDKKNSNPIRNNINNNEKDIKYSYYDKKENCFFSYIFRVILPKMEITLTNKIGNKLKFHKNIDIKYMGYFLKNDFKDWDYYILSTFSELKIFREELNKSLSKTFLENSEHNKTFNLSNSNIIQNTRKKDYKSYTFFYSFNKEEEKENFYFQIKIPKIDIIYQKSTNYINRQFDLDLRKIIQMNKFRKVFKPEKLIKYGITFVRDKNQKKTKTEKHNKNEVLRGNSLNSNKHLTKIKKYFNKNTDLNCNIIENNINIKNLNRKLTRKALYFSNDNVKDIKLDLDEYIFNYDEDLIKFINSGNEKNNNIYISDGVENNDYFQLLNQRDIMNNFSNKCDYILEIKLSKIELDWSNQILEQKSYRLEKEISEYLLEKPFSFWRKYIEKNILKIKEDSISIEKLINRYNRANVYAITTIKK